ncbi:MAG: hypothetical protein J6X94_10575 [Lachnospiraceae bacterium]|nr:hypothetical protein [Lachnospiraceae bacterium]
MTIKEFSGNMKKAVENILGEGYSIEEALIDKNNGVRLEALVIRDPGMNIAPTIYLRSYYENYEDGESLQEGAARLVEDYRKSVPEEGFDVSFYEDYECVKKGLSYKLISAERNKELLTNIPYVPFLDLAIVFYYAFEKRGLPDGSILIRNKHMEMWGVSTEQLMKDAGENAPVSLPGVCRDMGSVLERICPGKVGEVLPEDELKLPMYVLSNSRMINGAAAMLYPDILHNLSEVLESDLYIIPSSVHEVIVFARNMSDDEKSLKDMIRTVNMTQLEPQDVLSDSLYFYDRKDEKISIA